MDTLKGLYEVVENRKKISEEGSYTCYLFDKGLDKILKKCGEEMSEVIIAAKNNDKNELSNELCDVFYHLTVLMVNEGLAYDNVMDMLEERRKKIGNLKQMRVTDKDT